MVIGASSFVFYSGGAERARRRPLLASVLKKRLGSKGFLNHFEHSLVASLVGDHCEPELPHTLRPAKMLSIDCFSFYSCQRLSNKRCKPFWP